MKPAIQPLSGASRCTRFQVRNVIFFGACAIAGAPSTEAAEKAAVDLRSCLRCMFILPLFCS